MKRIARLVLPVIVAVLIPAVISHAQDEETLSFEEKYKDKDCIFLLYDVAIVLNEDWSYTTTAHNKMKILKESAKDMGEIPFYYEKGRERITRLEAYTITPDGEKHKCSKIQDFNVYKGYPMYSDYRYKLITLPEVNVGCILDYESVITSQGKPIKEAFWYTEYLGTGIPIEMQNITITLPKGLDIQCKEFDLEYKPAITEDEATITYSWHIRDIDCYKAEEPYTPPPDLDDISNVAEFSSIKEWSDISDWYYSLIQKNLVMDPKIERAAEKILKDHSGLKDKVRVILEYVQENFRYVSMSFGDNALEPHPTDEVFRNKYGDCKDLSLLCMAMLKAGGIKSHIALFREECDITDPQYDLPLPTQFDHVLLLVEDPEGGDFYIDPLLDGYDIGQYPVSYQRAYTFVIAEGGGKFDRFPVFDEGRSYSRNKRTVTIGQDSSALVEMDIIWDLDYSIKARDTFRAMDKEKKELFFQILNASLVSDGEVLERGWEGLDNKYGILGSYVKYKAEDMYPITDDMMIVDMPGFSNSTDFAKKERTKPIFYSDNALYENIIIYRLPEGFRVSHMPKDLDLDIGFFNVQRKYEKKESEIIASEIKRYRRMELPVEDYGKVRSFFEKLPQKTNQRIVLKKIKPWWEEVKDVFRRLKD